MLAIGNHCEFCGARDFLPFTCPKCEKSFCGTHREFHNCQPVTRPAHTKPAAKAQAKSSLTSQPTPLAPPQAKSQAKSQAKQTPKQSTSSKSASSEQNQAKQSALDKLRGLIGGKNTPKGALPPAAPTKTPFGELKKAATGDSKVPESERVYLWIKRPARTYKDVLTNMDQTQAAKTIPVFYHKETKIGRVIDQASVGLGTKGNSLRKGSQTIDSNTLISEFAGQTLVLE